MRDSDHDEYAVIRSQTSDLVLDASDYEVKVERFTGLPAQRWKLENAYLGTFFFVNQSNGKVLDIQGSLESGHNLITFPNFGGANQQWYVNSDNTIVSIKGNLALDISGGNQQPGTNVIAWEKHGGDNQKFRIEYQ
ncbi:hypothetical protein Zmor_002122 [Zophobas morio]|uniref:Ricin B lectin domain-containing protein n=1 Tax=Zophobas morio TaxID=2755281 RepID=A0AA38J045_9CUCU|nr:hypothetical protein Zmor_002122 [Zophobas morio]